MPDAVGGGSTTYACDYHTTNIPTAETLSGVLFGGAASNGSYDGFAYAYSSSAPSRVRVRPSVLAFALFPNSRGHATRPY